MSLSIYRLVALFLLLLLSGCATGPDDDPKDPLEPLNRPLWTFTYDYADKYVARPVSLTYGEYMPIFMRTGLYNMVQNLNEPSTFVNHLLVLNFEEAAKTSGRFVLNSTIGVLGFYDPAADFDWARNEKEFGEVLGRYGVPDGPFLVIPGYKATSVREEVGDFIDEYYWPYTLFGFWPSLAFWGINAMENRIALVEQEPLLEDAFDQYEFVKNAYFQNMKYKVWDGNPPVEELPEDDEDFENFLDEMDDFESYDDTEEPSSETSDN
ncbi:MlaA family lipoprotein [Thalassotalea agarivorans]|uniref:Phospholipid-binding lipoprotein MlaA n=1 Tax=Thalassotalea agarivorans TaxID=349064 RepID=A0A1H9Z7Y6_THASX|nr:VacJ family lipoprotein [Thalassotalea agarivorans]SES77555.1 phospholipid-binding lipoprotein MlaA [Thalassotalea agarivorans]